MNIRGILPYLFKTIDTHSMSVDLSDGIIFQNSIGMVLEDKIMMADNKEAIGIENINRIVIIKETKVILQIIGFVFLTVLVYVLSKMKLSEIVLLSLFVLIFVFAWILLFYNGKRYWIAISLKDDPAHRCIPIKKGSVRDADDLISEFYEYKFRMSLNKHATN